MFCIQQSNSQKPILIVVRLQLKLAVVASYTRYYFTGKTKKKRETKFTESWNHPSRIPKITRSRQYVASVHFLERDPERLLHEAVRK